MAFNFVYYSIAVFIVIFIVLLFVIKHYDITSTEILLSICLPAILVSFVIGGMPSCVLLYNTQYQVGMSVKSLSVPTLNMDPTAKVDRDVSKDRDEMPVTVYKLFHPEHILIKQDKLPDNTYKKDNYICQKCNLNRNCLYYQCEVTLDKFCARCILDFM